MRRLLAKHRAESRILVFFLSVVGAVLLLYKAASEVVEGDTLSFDRALLVMLRKAGDPATPVGPAWLHDWMVQLTALGSGAVLTVITLLAAGYLVAARRPATALLTLAAVAGGGLLAAGLKAIYARARPDVIDHLVGTHSASFPSGHAMNSAVVYLTLAVLLARTETAQALRIYLISAAIVLTVLVGLSRLYLGVHWPTDVIAGWIAGGLWAAGCSLTAKRLQSNKTVEGESP